MFKGVRFAKSGEGTKSESSGGGAARFGSGRHLQNGGNLPPSTARGTDIVSESVLRRALEPSGGPGSAASLYPVDYEAVGGRKRKRGENAGQQGSVGYDVAVADSNGVLDNENDSTDSEGGGTMKRPKKHKSKKKRQHKKSTKSKKKKSKKSKKKKKKKKKKHAWQVGGDSDSEDDSSDGDDRSLVQESVVAVRSVADMFSDAKLRAPAASETESAPAPETSSAQASRGGGRMAWMSSEFEASMTSLSRENATKKDTRPTKEFAGRRWTSTHRAAGPLVSGGAGEADGIAAADGAREEPSGPAFGYGLYDPKKAKPKVDPARSPAAAKVELNKLMAAAMKADLSGDATKKADLEKEIKALRADIEAAASAVAAKLQKEEVPLSIAPLDEHGRLIPSLLSGKDEELTRSDIRTGRRQGMLTKDQIAAKAEPVAGGGEGAAAERRASQLQREFREERMTGAQDMDKVYMKNLMKAGSRYKDPSGGVSRSGADEEYDVNAEQMSAMFTAKQEAMTAHKQQEEDQKRALAAHQKAETAQLKCVRCMNSQYFPHRKHLLLAIGEHCYLALAPASASVCDGHCYIIPMHHRSSMTNCDEDIWREASLFKRSLEQMFAAEEEPRSVVYLEYTRGPGRGHTFIEVIPMPEEIGADAPIIFKKEITDADEEWGVHKKLYSTTSKGLRDIIPPNFAYFHVEWAGGSKGYARGGYAHVVEDALRMKASFGIGIAAVRSLFSCLYCSQRYTD